MSRHSRPKQNYKLNYKTRLLMIDKQLDFITAFKKLVPDLKKVGSNYRAKSPFTEEKTPSFFVNKKKHMWHCFSTGQGGKNIVSFIAKKNNLKFSEALDWCETRFGLNRGKRTAKTMMSVIQMLNESQTEKQSENNDEKIKRVYEDQLLKLVKNFKKKSNDRWQVLDPIIEYVWEEFDDGDFHSLNSFKNFLRWAYKLLDFFRIKTIIPLHSFTEKTYT